MERENASHEVRQGEHTYHLKEGHITSPNSCSSRDLEAENTELYVGSVQVGSSSVRTLRVGSSLVPLTGDRGEYTFSENSQLIETDDSPLEVNGTATYSQTSFNYTTRLLYLDARHDIVVANVRRTGWSRNYTSSELTRINGVWNYSFAGSRMNETRDELIAIVDQQTQVLSSSVETDPASDTLGHQSGNLRGGGPGCTSVNESDPGVGEVFTDDFRIDALLHPAILGIGPATQGYGVDAAGRVLASQTIWQRQGATEVATGVWNYLTDGSLPSLFQGAPADPSYFPVGVLE